MKVVLYDIENHFTPSAMDDAMELVKDTHEFDLTQPEDGFYHCISRAPDYHVEITLKPDGLASAKCHCTVFRRTKQCKHVIAALLLLRDHILRSRRSRSKSKNEYLMLEEVLQKLKIMELRAFITGYARSHGTFRAEILANFLHLIKRPDYHNLLMDITPMDKYGSIKLNRNNLKTVRNIISTLMRQAQELLKEQALAEALQILDAALHHIYRLIIKVPHFREQLSTELRLALKIFDALCHQPMAPRLQQAAITLVTDISHRKGYFFLKGTTPLFVSIEHFILEEKTRRASFHLAEKKLLSDLPNQLAWACLINHWMRLWSYEPNGKEIQKKLNTLLPDMIQESSHHGDHDDVLFALKLFREGDYDKSIVNIVYQLGLRSARITGDKKWISKLASDLTVNYLDQHAWELLFESDPDQAKKILSLLKEYYTPGADALADRLLLHGWGTTGQHDQLLTRLSGIGNLELLMAYDHFLPSSEFIALENLYVKLIHEIREAYGGVIARQKLSNIFGHLKSINLNTPVVEKLKQMEKKSSEKKEATSDVIRGFVFDLDGVIVDTAVHHFQSWKKILKELGADISDEDDNHTRGASRMESLEYLINRYDIQLTQSEKEIWAAKKNEIYLEAIEQITPQDLLPGALRFLVDSRKAGLLLALGSASKNARGVLKKLQIEDRFDAILDGNDTQESKPHPEIFIKACNALHLDPAVVVVFEDAAKGVQAAKAAGCKVVGIGDPDTLRQADIVIAGLDESNPTLIIERLS